MYYVYLTSMARQNLWFTIYIDFSFTYESKYQIHLIWSTATKNIEKSFQN